MKKRFKFLIGAASLIACSTLIVPILTSCTETTKDNNQSNNDSDGSTNLPNEPAFIDNTHSYTSQIKNPEPAKFDPKSYNDDWKDFQDVTNDPNNKIYDALFQNINNETISNDINNMLMSLGEKSETNFGFKANIMSINIENQGSNWNISIIFNVFNNLNKENSYLISNLNKISFNPKEEKNISLNLNGKLERTFFLKYNQGSDLSKLFFGYKFINGTLKIDDVETNFNEFKFHDYSLSLNKYIEINTKEVGYNDIANFANEKLSTLTTENIQNEILQKYQVYIDTISKLLDPLQTLFQSLVDTKNNNKTIIEFLNDQSSNIANIANSLFQVITKNDQLNLYNIIDDVLSNKKISEIILSYNTKNIIVAIVDKLMPQISPAIKSLLNNINSDNVHEVINEVLKLLKTAILEYFPNLDEQEINSLINDLENEGLLTAIINNKSIIVNLLKSIPNLNTNPIIKNIIILIESIDVNVNLFDLIINIINIKNENNESVLKTIINSIIPNSTIVSLLNQLVFDNPNFTSENLVAIIDVFANPRDSKNGSIISWSDWFNNIKKTYTFNDNDGKIQFKYKFEFNKNIYLNIGKLYNILPSNLTINNTTIPVSLISIALPNWFSINAEDYIEINQNFDHIEYDVININGEYRLSWQSFTNTTIDMNLPQSLKTIYDTSTGAGSTLVNVLNNIFYHKYNITNYFKPDKSQLNEHIIKNYNPYKKNNNAIFINQLTDDKISEIKQNVDLSINENKIENSEYIISNGIFGIGKIVTNKYVTTTNIDPNELLSEYVNLTNYNSSYHISFDVNRIIRSSSILGFNIPKIDIKNLSLSTPYYVYSNNGQFYNLFNFDI